MVSYFCTADGNLIHAVGGPVTAEVLLDEAQWAVNVVTEMRKRSQRDQADFVRHAHRLATRPSPGSPNADRVWSRPYSSGQTRVHELLAEYACLPVKQVESTLFRMISGEEFESDRSAIMNAARAFTIAERKKRPILLILTARKTMSSMSGGWNRTTAADQLLRNTKVHRVLQRFEVVILPKIQLPAFTNLKKLRGLETLYNSNNNWQYADTYLMVDPLGEILSQLDSGNSIEFSRQLNSAWESWKKELHKNRKGS